MTADKRSVWVIEEGEYSSYRVVGVFSSAANAQAVVDAIAAGEESFTKSATVAEWTMDPAVDELRQGLSPYFVIMLKDGTVERSEKQPMSSYPPVIAGEVHMWRRTQAPAYKGKGIPDALQVHTWASDDTHAIKIANEHRARLLALNQWDSDSTA